MVNPWPIIPDEEFLKHNTEKDCWIKLHHFVLKLDDEFFSEHPGGPDVVTAHAGKDSSEDFEGIAHSKAARAWASKFIIGCEVGSPDDTRHALALPDDPTPQEK